MKTQINLKIDGDIKSLAAKRARGLGLSLSSVVNASLTNIASTGKLHITSSFRMTPYLESLIEEARKDYLESKTAGPFNSVEKMIKSLKS